jgi:hypothetical protein
MKSLWMAVAAVAAMAAIPAYADIVIDDFSTPASAAGAIITPGPNPTVIGPTNISAGLDRTTTWTVLVGSGTAGAPGLLDLVGQVGGGKVSSNLGNGATGTLELFYSYSSAFNFSGASALKIRNKDTDVAQGGVVTITTASGVLTGNITLPVSAGDTNTSMLFSSLAGGPTSWLSSVNSIEFLFTGAANADMTIDNISATSVPEPSTYMMMLTAVPALYFLRRRKA